MGYYVNPQDGRKEEWLEHNASRVSTPDSLPTDPSVRLVCLVDNGLFTAAGIVYDERELVEFKDPTDPRPKKWYTVKRDALNYVSSLPAYL